MRIVLVAVGLWGIGFDYGMLIQWWRNKREEEIMGWAEAMGNSRVPLEWDSWLNYD